MDIKRLQTHPEKLLQPDDNQQLTQMIERRPEKEVIPHHLNQVSDPTGTRSKCGELRRAPPTKNTSEKNIKLA